MLISLAHLSTFQVWGKTLHLFITVSVMKAPSFPIFVLNRPRSEFFAPYQVSIQSLVHSIISWKVLSIFEGFV